MNFKKLNDDEFLDDAFQSVFVIIYSRKREKITKSIIREIPGIITIFRSDGRLGFPGGRMEIKDLDEENIKSISSLRNTAIRETKEEIGYTIKNKDKLKLESNILVGKNQIVTFSYLISDNELNELYKNYSKIIGSFYNNDEIFGINRLYFTNESVKKNILKQNFKPSCKVEIENLISKYF